MTGTERISQEAKLPPKEEFFDAIKRHICHILGFDYGFIDLSRQHDLLNVYTFSAADDDVEARQFVEQLQDEHEQPLAVANTHLAQKVTHTQAPWVGRAFNKNKDESDDPEGYPYVIVPMMENPVFGTGKQRGLIRVISFDSSREVSAQDVSTLKNLGEHLTSKLPKAADLFAAEEDEDEATDSFTQKRCRLNRPFQPPFAPSLFSRARQPLSTFRSGKQRQGNGIVASKSNRSHFARR